MRLRKGSASPSITRKSIRIWLSEIDQLLSALVIGILELIDIEVTDATKGVILKSANGTRFRITIADDGSLTTTAV